MRRARPPPSNGHDAEERVNAGALWPYQLTSHSFSALVPMPNALLNRLPAIGRCRWADLNGRSTSAGTNQALGLNVAPNLGALVLMHNMCCVLWWSTYRLETLNRNSRTVSSNNLVIHKCIYLGRLHSFLNNDPSTLYLVT